MDRRQHILSMFDPSGFGLEIGPSYNALLPKSEGFNVETIDYTDQEGLRAKYATNPTVDVGRIEPVDHVSDGRSMRDVIGEEARYDFIVASHVIEHTPDMLGFLKDCESLLKPSGVLVLAVPDKRCCFDVYQRLTSTGDVLEAHRARRTRPGFGSLFDAIAYDVKQNGATGWPKGSKGDRQLASTLHHALDTARRSEASGQYVDVHVWRFVPASFELILTDLFEIGETPLRIQSLQATDEFLIVLSREDGRSRRSRLELLEASNLEQAYEYLAALDATRSSESPHAQGELLPASDEEKSALRQTMEAENEALRQASDHEKSELRRSLQAAQAEIQMLRSSTSWRITQPLRALRERVR